MVEKINNRGQITIFIILALILVVIIAMLFLLFRSPEQNIVDDENPQAFIEKCTKDAVNEALEILMPQGGYLEPQNYKLHENKKLAYLCYTGEYYQTCSNQVPMLIEHIEQEIIDYTRPRIANCFQILESKLEGRYDIVANMDELNINVNLQPKQVIVDIEKEFKMTHGSDVRIFNDFKIKIMSPIYELTKLTLKILSREAISCNFDYVDYVMLYPENDIRKFVTGDSSRIYTLREKVSGEEFIFAIRNCVMPPGF
jgi:hypothetical protein